MPTTLTARLTSLVVAPIAACIVASCTSTSQASISEQDLASVGYRKLEVRDSVGALATFEQALAVDASAKLQAGKGRALEQMGQYGEARAAFIEAIRLDPSNPDWHVGLSVVELRAGDLSAAIDACDDAIAIDPHQANAHYNRGCALLAAKSIDEAILALETAARWAPGFARAHNTLGVALAQDGQTDAAIEHFRYATSIGVLPEAHANCASIYHTVGETKLALQELNAALRIAGTDVHYLLNRAQVYLDLQESDLAARDLEDAQRLAPTHPRVVRLLKEQRALEAEVTVATHAQEFSAAR